MSELRQRIQDVIDNEPVAVFMKGTPQFIMCGNSDRALRALREAGAPVAGIDACPCRPGERRGAVGDLRLAQQSRRSS